ncbi:HYC_CC_PP family protein [Flaviaesturariibacter aridisoli]|uniref:Uncharacterized protein n=1 Tax=Flaviaesturariibacter aridisoli TaxID=2545761 RepID=A0A4R4E4L9_9BACT|nr:hypothetical protein [Flaviaesturariibacter aridisoli]TCZ74536.1 hypothetical protein E0486_02610 [Flaviaesturariibacter aridisoli]
MKKLFAILTLLAYFTVSTGFVVNLHYCMDRYHSWELGAPKADRCDTCGMSVKKNGCCHDQVKLVKVQQDATGAQYALFTFAAAPALLPPQPMWEALLSVPATDRSATPIHGPPLLSRQDTYLRHCVFRI